MIHEDIPARDFKLELNHGRASWRYSCRLDIGQGGGGQGCLVIDPIEYLADDMEGGCEVGSADTEEDPHGLTDVCLEGFLLGQAADCAVEHQVLRVFIEQSLQIFREMTRGAEGFVGIHFTLHHVEFTVHGGQSLFRFYKDQAVHAIRDVLGNHWGCAVIHKQT